jgi:hypothetical protein
LSVILADWQDAIQSQNDAHLGGTDRRAVMIEFRHEALSLYWVSKQTMTTQVRV